MKVQLFPQISRIFSAPVIILSAKMSLWVFLIGFLLLNLYGRLLLAPYWQTNIGVLTRPFSSDAHIAVATNAWTQGNWQQAKNELLVAQSLIATTVAGETNVLGAKLSPLELLGQWENEPAKLKKEESFWQSVVNQRPDYRDGFIALIALQYQLNEKNMALQNLQTAQTIDPNYLFVNKFSELLAKTD